ncbi:hypothetical protein Q765_17525 [Flavobacterium rivuli WB 3.3-2 = DSM 21788]|uniref:tRNA_anti-like n=1 Tax=Flavobacterium rivuli WB 3.3-2 = DSM 21788 TaxID=1121895 RepID=A0A0A2LXT7_9FLAO|nr:hypothetical protein [Flavobacterium rivuli]KGO85167.1 hypothetical protein Q765_17525 [Flavobacterium rivuli WB 3.3-2 = DSM 21788]
MRKKVVIITIAVVLLAGVWLYKGYLYKEVRNISKEAPAYTLTADELVSQYTNNQQQANADYLNKTIQITGNVTQVSDSVVTINSLIVCCFDEKPNAPANSKIITIKGRCIGYDELFNEVKLDQCTIKP